MSLFFVFRCTARQLRVVEVVDPLSHHTLRSLECNGSHLLCEVDSSSISTNPLLIPGLVPTQTLRPAMEPDLTGSGAEFVVVSDMLYGWLLHLFKYVLPTSGDIVVGAEGSKEVG